MTCIGERLRFPYLEGRVVINWRTGEAKKNSQGGKYEMYHRTPSVFKSGKGWKINRRPGEAKKKFAGGE